MLLVTGHVNTGTALSRKELPRPTMNGRVMRLPKHHVEVEEDSHVTPYGGLALVVDFLRQFDVAARLDAALSLRKQYQPYTEADHVLAQTMNLYVGGTCIEDLAHLQGSEAVRRLVGACRLPDPTTAGDFLRRFDPARNPGSLAALRQVVDAVQAAVWQRRDRKPRGKHTPRERITIDIDAHLKEVYGRSKEGADFSRTGKWSYNQLLVSMAGTGECLAVRNRPGNIRDSEGAAALLDETLARVRPYGQSVLVRGDSDFDRRDVRDVCVKHGAHFALVGREFANRPGIAESIAEEQWQAFAPRAARHAAQRRKQPGYRARRKRRNRRRQRARERGYKDLRQVCQWVAEVPWTPPHSNTTYRLVLRRQRIEHWEGQQLLFTDYRYRYLVTNLPPSVSTHQVVDETYERCDQENMIEQMGSGIAAWRMPAGDFWANCAWLEMARLAWNLGKWIAQLALPAEVVRWEWKRFRHAFVYLAATVVKRSRQIWIRFSASHRFLAEVVSAHHRMLR
jgi:hypothetical protein